MLPGFPPLLEELLADPAERSPVSTSTFHWNTLQTELALWEKLATESPPHRAKLIQLLMADQDMTNDDVRWCLGHIHAHLISKYQGSIAEYLAATRLSLWVSEEVAQARLGSDLLLVMGDEIRERRDSGKSERWDRGADALVIGKSNDETELIIVGVVEVKSYYKTLHSIAPQIEAHLQRIRAGGVRIGSREWSHHQVKAAFWDKDAWMIGQEDEAWENVVRVLVTPPSLGKNLEFPQNPYHRLHLPASNALLATASYGLTVRFLERLGAEAFNSGSRWPEMTPEAAATNAVHEALLHIIQEGRVDSSPTFARIARSLYNVYGFGHAAAAGEREMLWVDPMHGTSKHQGTGAVAEDPDQDAPVGELVDQAWSLFHQGSLEPAERWAMAASGRNPGVVDQKRVLRLLGMLSYYSGDFARCCERMPDPGERTKTDGWWERDLLTIARAYVRSGEPEMTKALLHRLTMANSKWNHIHFSVLVLQGWIAQTRDQEMEADRWLVEALEELGRLRRDSKKRADEGLGQPLWQDVGDLQSVIVDLAALLSLRGMTKDAFMVLEPMGNMSRPLVDLIVIDPAFDALRHSVEDGPQLEQWLGGAAG